MYQTCKENQSTGNISFENSGSGSTMVPQEGEGNIETESDDSQLSDSAPAVYFISDILPEGLMAVYEKLNWMPDGGVAVKLSTGEPPASNYLCPELIKDFFIYRITLTSTIQRWKIQQVYKDGIPCL